jgi:hypothetical protein
VGLMRSGFILRSGTANDVRRTDRVKGLNRFVIQGSESGNSTYQQFHGNCAQTEGSIRPYLFTRGALIHPLLWAMRTDLVGGASA